MSPPVTGFTPRTFVEVEAEHLLAMLTHFHWNISLTARELGSDRRTVYRKMQRFGISKPKTETKDAAE